MAETQAERRSIGSDALAVWREAEQRERRAAEAAEQQRRASALCRLWDAADAAEAEARQAVAEWQRTGQGGLTASLLCRDAMALSLMAEAAEAAR